MTPKERAARIVHLAGAENLDQDEHERLIVAAIHAEREACARLAKKIGAAVETGPGGDCVQGCQGVADEIAATIRGQT